MHMALHNADSSHLSLSRPVMENGCCFVCKKPVTHPSVLERHLLWEKNSECRRQYETMNIMRHGALDLEAVRSWEGEQGRDSTNGSETAVTAHEPENHEDGVSFAGAGGSSNEASSSSASPHHLEDSDGQGYSRSGAFDDDDKPRRLPRVHPIPKYRLPVSVKEYKAARMADLAQGVPEEYELEVLHPFARYRREAAGSPYYPFLNKTESVMTLNKLVHNFSWSIVDSLNSSYMQGRHGPHCHLCGCVSRVAFILPCMRRIVPCPCHI
eukprot:53109-Eustigmatos_ZCMA.PRE.1